MILQPVFSRPPGDKRPKVTFSEIQGIWGLSEGKKTWPQGGSSTHWPGWALQGQACLVMSLRAGICSEANAWRQQVWRGGGHGTFEEKRDLSDVAQQHGGSLWVRKLWRAWGAWLAPLFFVCLFVFWFLFCFYMKFIVKLVSIQHPVLIPTGALLSAHHPPSHLSHLPSTLNWFSVFKSLLWFGSLPLFFFSFPSPMVFC